MTPKTEIVPDQTEVVASQQATIARLMEFKQAQGLEIEELKSQLALKETFRRGELEAMDCLQVELEAARKASAEANEKLDFLTTSLESGSLPYWQKKHDDILEKWYQAEAQFAEMRDLFTYIDEYVISPFLVQGKCDCVLDSRPCCYCASRHANNVIQALKQGDHCKDYIHKEQVKPLVEALGELMDWQNGPPMFGSKWETGYGNAMEKAREALAHAKQIGIE